MGIRKKENRLNRSKKSSRVMISLVVVCIRVFVCVVCVVRRTMCVVCRVWYTHVRIRARVHVLCSALAVLRACAC